MDPDADVSPRRSRLSVVAAYSALAFVVWYVVDLAVMRADPTRFIDVHRVMGHLVVRLLIVAVWFGLLVHGLDGLRVTIRDAVPDRARLMPRLDAAVQFLTCAVGIPVALVIVWPAIRTWFS